MTFLERIFSIYSNQITFQFPAGRHEEGQGKERRAFWGTLIFWLKPKSSVLCFLQCSFSAIVIPTCMGGSDSLTEKAVTLINTGPACGVEEGLDRRETDSAWAPIITLGHQNFSGAK